MDYELKPGDRNLDEIDLEAMREGEAISGGYKRVGHKPKNYTAKEDQLQPGKEYDRLKHYDIIHGRIEE